MKRLPSFLSTVRGDVYKLLPMRESYDLGTDNHLYEYLEGLIVNLRGSISEYSELANSRKYLYVINELQYMRNNNTSFKVWRRIVLRSTREIDDLFREYSKE